MLQWGRALSSAEMHPRTVRAHRAHDRASMGPRPFERGNSAVTFGPRTIARLQWGRALSSAEIVGNNAGKLDKFELQWGRALSSAEIRAEGHLWAQILR